mmetsp:Transcript_11911/g.21648  ORF Transcript_11911/g.21648 Transcript_11911/m.21648 type:complete len:96 (+) Transcript_11911:98-385(+)
MGNGFPRSFFDQRNNGIWLTTFRQIIDPIHHNTTCLSCLSKSKDERNCFDGHPRQDPLPLKDMFKAIWELSEGLYGGFVHNPSFVLEVPLVCYLR